MPLKVASLSESLVTMKACIRFCQLFNILYNERVPPANTDCQNISAEPAGFA